MRTPFVIAEFSGCHAGDLDRMLRGVAAARECDADAFKTWWCSSAEHAAARLHAPELADAYRVGQFPTGWLPIIREACKANGLELIITVDCADDVPVVAPFVDRMKVASWGATDAAFIETCAKYGKPLIISTGVLTWTEHERMCLNGWSGATILHCVSAYPTPLEDVNLAVLHRQEDGQPFFDGFSDHTRKVLMGALAVAAGARILEVHFCLPDTPADSPDRVVSHEPDALAEYIALARKAAVALGDGVKRVMPSEKGNTRFRYV